MSSDIRLIASRTANSRTAQPFSMSDKKAPSNSNRPEKPPLLNRDLSWQIAPNLFSSFLYAGAGLKYAFLTQRNFRIHTVISLVAVGLGIFLHISTLEMALIALMIAVVLTLELLNTALESVVDLTVRQSYHELAKIAKDCAAGAVLLGAIAAIVVAGLILLPPLLALIE